MEGGSRGEGRMEVGRSVRKEDGRKCETGERGGEGLGAKQRVAFCVRADKQCTHSDPYLFLFSTSSTSSSVENCPVTDITRFRMMSSLVSTSNRPPTTTGRREGFT